jgi:hypothetical protein
VFPTGRFWVFPEAQADYLGSALPRGNRAQTVKHCPSKVGSSIIASFPNTPSKQTKKDILTHVVAKACRHQTMHLGVYDLKNASTAIAQIP